jgi:hypothetical protein
MRAHVHTVPFSFWHTSSELYRRTYGSTHPLTAFVLCSLFFSKNIVFESRIKKKNGAQYFPLRVMYVTISLLRVLVLMLRTEAKKKTLHALVFLHLSCRMRDVFLCRTKESESHEHAPRIGSEPIRIDLQRVEFHDCINALFLCVLLGSAPAGRYGVSASIAVFGPGGRYRWLSLFAHLRQF